ncbi:MAG: hypothetical protein JRN26_06550 [Nitrososphaerota archaeon]|jgi:flagellin-like hook-associated protein FlgL|nr:hypothetical protein [Nitrososphaerota archaeon]MDG6936522.1 hypothetical protein [Nitrososphaerota archaeon]MDG6944997.1 hypothetical protein [Nitrososphaerota archaeon]
MKYQTIFLGFLLALFATLPAASAFAATSYSISVQTSAPSYVSGQTVVVSGTVSPVPSAGTAVTLKVTGPTGGQYLDSATVSSTGAYSFSFVLLPSSNWPAGTYSVNVTWAESYQGPYASNTASFVVTSVPVHVAPAYTVSAFASSPVSPGQNVEVEAVALWSNGSAVKSASFPMAEFVEPSGAVVSLGAPTQIQNGVYMWSMAVPSSASTGVYSVILESNISMSTQFETTSFTVNDVSSSIASLSSSVSSLSGAVTSLQNTVSSVSSSVSSIQGTVTSMNSALSTVSSEVSSMQSSVSSMSSTVGSLSTYLIVVAVLAVIIIIIQIIMLVRRK